jgi:penicillin-binding protein 2
VYCPGWYQLGRHRWRCDKESGHGSVDLQHALGASCNVFYYTLGDRLGTDKIAKWARLLGLGQPTGFDLGGEISGNMPDAAWHDRHIPGGYQHGMSLNIAIGQGDVKVTPMQQLVLYGAIASGVVWKPQVVRRIEDPRGETLQEFAPAERGRIPFRQETREAVLEGLHAAVNEPYGTGWWSRLRDVVMAGKTGTAQVVKLGARRLKASQLPYFERDHAWFASFAPIDDPEIVVVVLNEHAGFGASNAAPTASALIRYYYDLKRQDAGFAAALPPAEAAAAAIKARGGVVTLPPTAAPAPAAPAKPAAKPASAPVASDARSPGATPAVAATPRPAVVPIPPAEVPRAP